MDSCSSFDLSSSGTAPKKFGLTKGRTFALKVWEPLLFTPYILLAAFHEKPLWRRGRTRSKIGPTSPQTLYICDRDENQTAPCTHQIAINAF